MFFSELLERLRADGFTGSRRVVDYAIEIGFVDRPPKNALGFRVFGEDHLIQMREYLRIPHPQGAKPRRERMEATT